jgi:sulfate/thiosulfate-binding protein
MGKVEKDRMRNAEGKRAWLWAVAALLAVALLGAACGGDDNADASSSGGGAKLALVAYSTPKEAYEQIIEAFRKTDAGADISFTQSYGASGDQSRAVESGLAADYVGFSLEPDMTRLVKADMVASDWNTGEEKGMVTDSVVAFVVRKGNPENIKTWDDLIEDGVDVITPNPFTSGGARWNVMAAYGSQIEQGKSEAEALDYLGKLFANVSVQDDSARKALQTFTSGKGDVMLAYENEAIFARDHGQAIDFVVPDETILIENPAAVTSTSEHAEQAKAFLDFVRSKDAQRIFADNGYRPVIDGVAKDGEFPQPSGLFDISEFGGWSEVTAKFFDPEKGLMADIERDLGVSVEKK